MKAAKQSPRIESDGSLRWYEGDTFSLTFNFTLKDVSGDVISIKPTDVIKIQFRNDKSVIHEFSQTGTALLNVLATVVTCIILPLISFLGLKLTQWLNTKIKNDKGKALMEKATQIVLDSVRCVFQSYVEALKKSGGFDQKAQIYAFNLAKDTALKQLGDDAKNYISENYGDLQDWLKTEIEASINKLKN